MWSKLYFAVLGLSVAVMAFFTYYSWSWLQSIGVPQTALDSAYYFSSLAEICVLISTVGLLLLGNAIYWSRERLWGLWATFMYFTFWVLLLGFWLLPNLLLACEKLNQCSYDYSRQAIAVISVLIIGVIVFFDQFLVIRLRAKTYGHPQVAAEQSDNEIA